MLVARVRCVQPAFAVTRGQRAGRRGDLPTARRPPPRPGAGRRAGEALHPRRARRPAARPHGGADDQRPRRARPPPHAARRARVELRPARRARAHALPQALGLRRRVDAGRRRAGVRRPGHRRAGHRGLAAGQEPRAQADPGRRGRVRPPREPARVRRGTAGRRRRRGPRPATGTPPTSPRPPSRWRPRSGCPPSPTWWSGASASEEANFLSAWEHSLAEGHLGRALHLAAALGWHSFFRGHLGTGRARLDRTLQAAAEAPPDDALAAAVGRRRRAGVDGRRARRGARSTCSAGS